MYLYVYIYILCKCLCVHVYVLIILCFQKTATCDNAAIQRLVAEGLTVQRTVMFIFRIHVGFLLTQQ